MFFFLLFFVSDSDIVWVFNELVRQVVLRASLRPCRLWSPFKNGHPSISCLQHLYLSAWALIQTRQEPMSSWPRRSTRDIRSAIQRFINCKLFNSVKMKIRLGFPLHLGARALSSLNLVKKRDYSQSNLIRISLAPSFSPSWNQCCCLWPRCYLLITKYDQHFHF